MSRTRMHWTPLERRLIFGLLPLQRERQWKRIRAVVVGNGHDTGIPLYTIAEPLRSHDRKQLGSGYQVLVCQNAHDGHLCLGNVIEVGIRKSICLADQRRYHIGIYRRRVHESAEQCPMSQTDLLEAYRHN